MEIWISLTCNYHLVEKVHNSFTRCKCNSISRVESSILPRRKYKFLMVTVYYCYIRNCLTTVLISVTDRIAKDRDVSVWRALGKWTSTQLSQALKHRCQNHKWSMTFLFLFHMDCRYYFNSSYVKRSVTPLWPTSFIFFRREMYQIAKIVRSGVKICSVLPPNSTPAFS